LSIKLLSGNFSINSLVFLRISSGMLLGSLSLGLFGGSMSSSFFLGGGSLLSSSGSSELFFLSGLLSGGSFSSLSLGNSLLFLGLSSFLFESLSLLQQCLSFSLLGLGCHMRGMISFTSSLSSSSLLLHFSHVFHMFLVSLSHFNFLLRGKWWRRWRVLSWVMRRHRRHWRMIVRTHWRMVHRVHARWVISWWMVAWRMIRWWWRHGRVIVRAHTCRVRMRWGWWRRMVVNSHGRMINWWWRHSTGSSRWRKSSSCISIQLLSILFSLLHSLSGLSLLLRGHSGSSFLISSIQSSFDLSLSLVSTDGGRWRISRDSSSFLLRRYGSNCFLLLLLLSISISLGNIRSGLSLLSGSDSSSGFGVGSFNFGFDLSITLGSERSSGGSWRRKRHRVEWRKDGGSSCWGWESSSYLGIMLLSISLSLGNISSSLSLLSGSNCSSGLSISGIQSGINLSIRFGLSNGLSVDLVVSMLLGRNLRRSRNIGLSRGGRRSSGLFSLNLLIHFSLFNGLGLGLRCLFLRILLSLLQRVVDRGDLSIRVSWLSFIRLSSCSIFSGGTLILSEWLSFRSRLGLGSSSTSSGMSWNLTGLWLLFDLWD